MNEFLTLDRFEALADAYGGVIAHWPEQFREAAMRMAAQPDAARILAQASALDEALDTWTVPLPTDALRQNVIRDAPAPSRGWAIRARLWWSGIGIVAALAGAATGTAAVAVVSPVDTSASSTSFGDVGQQER
ncbi:hypothetical protein KX816_09735 [Sphingosinicellaceae bacterium]|nr:hypothetical protein KX816_09735 [Sphingosinicellaceae bacterium]